MGAHQSVEPVSPKLNGQSQELEDETPEASRRKRFPGLGRIVFFFGLIAALSWGFHALVSHGLRRITTSKFGSINRVFSGQVNADLVINGSSRALVHYDPRIIEAATGLQSYNLGMNAVQIDVQLAILKSYLRRNAKPKVVVQNLESFTFETTKRGEIYDPGLYIPYLSEETLYQSLLEIDPTVWKWRHIPLYGYAVEDMRFTWMRGILGFFGHTGREDYFNGFNPRHTPWTEDFELFKRNVGAGVNYRIEPKGVDALIELIKICQAADIRLILVYSPEYYEMQAMEVNRKDVFAVFARLSGEFQVPFLDYSSSPLCRQRDYFYNSQHLNAQGADLFSKDVARKIAEIIPIHAR